MNATLYVLEAGVLHIVERIDPFYVIAACRADFNSATYTTIVSDRNICQKCLQLLPRDHKYNPLADLANQFGKMQRKIVRDAPPGTFPFPIVEEPIPQEQSE